MEELKTRFLATHHGYFFGPGDMPITSAGRPDWDTFLIFVINQGTDMIDYYTIYDMVKHVPVEMKSLYAKRINTIEKTINVKPKHPKLLMPQSSAAPTEERFQKALEYYNKCEENIRECNKMVLDAIDKVIADEDPGRQLLDRIRSEVSVTLQDEEIEAVIMHIKPDEKTFSSETAIQPSFTRKNTLLALKVLNRFAREHEIRFEDAVTVFSEAIEKNMLL